VHELVEEVPKGLLRRAHATSPLMMAAAFSPIMIVAAFVLPRVIVGMTDASATLSPSTP
jgi:hypothetical protein